MQDQPASRWRAPSETDRAGRVVVETDLGLADHPNVFVIGDLAAASDVNGQAVPGVAPAAEQGGEHVALYIAADLVGTAEVDAIAYANEKSNSSCADSTKRLLSDGSNTAS